MVEVKEMWFAYFLITIGIVGGIFAYGLSMPLLWIGRFFRPCWLLGGRVLRRGVDVLMKCQPWYRAEIDFRLPQAPYVTLSNHRSHLDVFILLTLIPNIRLVAKQTLFRIPFLGLMMRALKSIPIRQGDIASYQKAMEKVGEAVREGDPVHLFPEMTRSPEGFRGVQPFQLAPFHILLKEKVKVVPIVFRDTDRSWPKGKVGISFRRPIHVRTLEPIDPTEFESAQSFRDAVQKLFERELCS